MSDALLIGRPAPGVVMLTLNRPERRNALSNALLAEIADALAGTDADAAARVAIITGGGSLFAAGADLDEVAALGSGDAVEGPRFLSWQGIRRFAKPLVGAIEGWCLGAGLELALTCDLLVAGVGAQFGFPETNLGIMPGGGGTALLPRRIGPALAAQMVLTGEPITAAQAAAAGMVAEVVADGGALAAALAVAERLAQRAPLALRAAKASLRDTDYLPLDQHVRAERARYVELMGTGDKAEGIAAFRDRRPPHWTGR